MASIETDIAPDIRELSATTAGRDTFAVRTVNAAAPCTHSGTQVEAITAELG